jgi:hypothetical protein
MTEREAVEARADKWLDEQGWGAAITGRSAMKRALAGFSLVENAELRKALAEYTDNRKVADCVDCGGSIWFREARMEDASGTYHPMCRVAKRAEAAEAEVVKLREVLERIANHKPTAPTPINTADYSVLKRLAESALNPGAAKEGA